MRTDGQGAARLLAAMKILSSSSENDDSLRHTLQAWKLTPPLPPRFQEQVWRRIARAEAEDKVAAWSRLTRWTDRVLARPALAAAYLALLLTSGSGAGYWHVRREAAQLDQTLGLRYVQAVDPYQAPRN